jgi:hypothetical protein
MLKIKEKSKNCPMPPSKVQYFLAKHLSQIRNSGAKYILEYQRPRTLSFSIFHTTSEKNLPKNPNS